MSFEEKLTAILIQKNQTARENEVLEEKVTTALEKLILRIKENLPDTHPEMDNFRSSGMTTWAVKIDGYGLELNHYDFTSRLKEEPNLDLAELCEQIILDKIGLTSN
ncbi:hypothetical protein M5X04_27035 [Paenibacillus alvei]|uniref:Uncharacterized protein n=1 Tax=Paenibacillus alvei TaxID=44250 RepID=A0ABT4EGU6_PAEAL|nr:hypothetical protein [Paenibacillus alvei]MCY9532969.1 hypothetical protein [Paenibacillus alvei]